MFDVLSVNGVDLRSQRWTTRHRRLELLAASWTPPLQVSPVTADPAEAREWLAAFGHTGVEGLVVKGAAGRYEPGKRSWIKWKTRETIEVICGAVTGSLIRSEVVVAGRYHGKNLEVVGRTVPLNDHQAHGHQSWRAGTATQALGLVERVDRDERTPGLERRPERRAFRARSPPGR